MFVAMPAFAQAALEGKTILSVHVSGLDHIKESVVLEQIKSVPGTQYHRATAVRDVVRLDRLGVFGGISVAGVAGGRWRSGST